MEGLRNGRTEVLLPLLRDTDQERIISNENKKKAVGRYGLMETGE
ncbi:hypothetical protein BH20ACI2_BH20ACI2_07260 [soil metagenome]